MHRANVDSLTSETDRFKVDWPDGHFRRILVAFNGSESSWRALRIGIALAQSLPERAELLALSVEDSLPRFPATIDEVQEEREQQDSHYRRLHQQAVEVARQQKVHLQTAIVPGRVIPTILRYARDGRFDLLLIGGRLQDNFWSARMGTASRVKRCAPCQVMVVP